MHTLTQNIETCLQLRARLPWNHTAAARSARILCSKAICNGLDQDEAFKLILEFPAADYVRKNPHLLCQAWAIASGMIDQHNYLSESEQLLAVAN
jgi:hypothetical protein